jgi:5'-methylthioadenosine phosphorylase
VTPSPRIGVIGGSGLYGMEGLTDAREVAVDTPFGAPSDALVVGSLDGVAVAFLARHGRGHRLLPGDINYRANVYALKSLGVERVLSASAVGSMKESIRPRDVVLPDQFIDRTHARASTFFGGGVAAHVAFAEPVCPVTRRALAEAARGAGVTVHDGGTYVCMEGPAFSTRAESLLHRTWGVDVIGMTNATEAKLAREAELCYATLALVTDYDCWHASEEAVHVEAVVENLEANAAKAAATIRAAASALAKTPERTCACATALSGAIISSPAAIGPDVRARLGILLDNYVSR